jgi:hypothetical protein
MTTKNLATVLTEDHHALARVCTELEMSQGSPENRKELADHLIAEFVRHLVAEEPFLSDTDPHGIDRVMRRLADTGPQEPRFENLLSALIRIVREHVHEIGPAVVQQVRSDYSANQLREFGEAVTASRSHARSLPHPAVKDRVPASALLQRGPGFIDRARASVS